MARYVQVGIRGPMYGEDEDFGYQRGLGVTTLDIGMVKRDGVQETLRRARDIAGSSPVYLTFDIDSVDPAFAPGTGTPEVGGLTPREALAILRGLAGIDVIGADVVEVAPQYDATTNTAHVGAQMLFTELCLVAANPKRTKQTASATRR